MEVSIEDLRGIHADFMELRLIQTPGGVGAGGSEWSHFPTPTHVEEAVQSGVRSTLLAPILSRDLVACIDSVHVRVGKRPISLA